jgi:hypothetical protein
MNEPIGRFGSFSPERCGGSPWNRLDRLVLADDALVQLVLQLEQPLGLLLLQALQRDAGHLRDDLGDDLLVDDAADLLARGSVAPLAKL